MANKATPPTTKVAPQRRLPPAETLIEWKQQEGLTHEQIVARVRELTGRTVTPAAVSVALSRAGLTQAAPRYDDVIPWKVRGEHTNHYTLEMLRAEGRRRRGLPLSEDKRKRLESWMNQLREADAVVIYLPWSDDGFHYIYRNPEIDVDPEAIIRHPDAKPRKRPRTRKG